MTVKELIEQLQKYPQDAIVMCWDKTCKISDDMQVVSTEYDTENAANEVTLYIEPL